MIAITLGSSGLVGSHLLNKIIQDQSINNVRVLSRRSIGIKHPKVKELMISDLSQIQSLQADLKGDLYFCTLGSTIKKAGSKDNFRKVDYEAIVSFGKVAESHQGKSLVVVSATGADPHSRIFYNQVKGETEAALKKLKLPSLTILQPGLLIGERQDFRFGERLFILLMQPLALLMPASLRKRIMTDVDHLSQVMLELGKAARPGTATIHAEDI